ncbi:hypothetical protein ACFPDQ_07000 [Pseudofrancisella aestuarii]|uniref:Lipoprotein n=1 Tax=Pseudofrancisella aestuarii TaxID=2670347 RepID=A0ABV9TCF5_9GAMM|nr:hypothetical protein [Pseudofrancisella aestuarii]
MRNLFKVLLFSLFLLGLTSCGNLLTKDKFVYLGHGVNTPNYQLYYDKTRKMFMLVDKRHGCFERDYSGTCIAFTLEEAEQFREQALAKMIDIDTKLAQDSYGNQRINDLDKAGITTIRKSIDIGTIKATPIKQVIVDREKEYALVKDKYKLAADLVGTIVSTNGHREIKVFYVVSFPAIAESSNANTILEPFIVDPEYLYLHMTNSAVKQVKKLQTKIEKKNTVVKKEVTNYLGEIVDGKPANTNETESEKAAANLKVSTAQTKVVSSGSSEEVVQS